MPGCKAISTAHRPAAAVAAVEVLARFASPCAASHCGAVGFLGPLAVTDAAEQRTHARSTSAPTRTSVSAVDIAKTAAASRVNACRRYGILTTIRRCSGRADAKCVRTARRMRAAAAGIGTTRNCRGRRGCRGPLCVAAAACRRADGPAAAQGKPRPRWQGPCAHPLVTVTEVGSRNERSISPAHRRWLLGPQAAGECAPTHPASRWSTTAALLRVVSASRLRGRQCTTWACIQRRGSGR